MKNAAHWRGLVALVRDAVEHGSRAVEKVQIETARRPFAIIEQIPPIAAPTRLVHTAHDAGVTVVHGMIRVVNAAAAKTIDIVLEQAGKSESVGREEGEAATPPPRR